MVLFCPVAFMQPGFFSELSPNNHITPQIWYFDTQNGHLGMIELDNARFYFIFAIKTENNKATQRKL